jgi:hypothetical protein
MKINWGNIRTIAIDGAEILAISLGNPGKSGKILSVSVALPKEHRNHDHLAVASALREMADKLERED